MTVTDVANPITKLKAVKKKTVKSDAIAKATQIRELAAKLETAAVVDSRNDTLTVSDVAKHDVLRRARWEEVEVAVVGRVDEELAATTLRRKDLSHEKLAADYVKEQSLLRLLFDYL